MIHSIKNICNLLAGFLLLVSCTDETLIGPKKIVVEEGLPVTAKLAFGTSDPVKIETRVSDISENDQVRSLAVLIFKRDGGSMVKVDNTFFFDADALTMGAVTLKTTTGDRYVYAVANYKSSVFGDLTYKLENVNTLEGLNELCIELEENNTSVLDGQFLMSGYFIGNTESTEKGACCITENGVVDRSGNSGFIDLKRIMSSVKFKVYSDTPGATFIVDSWQVKNIPQRSFVLEQNGECSGMIYDNTKKSSVFVEEDGKKTFSFLMMESKKQAAGISSRDDREKMSDSPENFVNAPDNSTYVVLKGVFSGTTDESVDGDIPGRAVTAYVTYYIHLGDWSSGDATDYNNYKILRNNRYIYTVKVRGVDDLIVEVQTENENWSGDGDMLVSTDNVRIFDAHYETTIISFTKKMLGDLRAKYCNGSAADCSRELFKEKFLIHAATPKNHFHADATDVNWVTYRRNTDGNVAHDFMKYKYSANDNTLLNADGFKNDLYDVYDVLADGESVYYTCFIDEYFYGKANGDYDKSVMKLSEFVNQQPRILQICTNYTGNDEPSSNSSVSTAAYTFSQRSMCTVYDLDRVENNNVNGWGTEWTQESENMSVASPAKSQRIPTRSSLSQGHEATWAQLGGSMISMFDNVEPYTWGNYLDYKTNTLHTSVKVKSYTFKPHFADYGCLSRNRDLNGDGRISKDELRWYLPAINQYVEFVIGADVLPEEVTLANRNKYDSKEIYVSSTAWGYDNYIDNNVDIRLLKANEGSSTVFCGRNNSTPYPYRCIRNLRSVAGSSTALMSPGNGVVEDDLYKYLYFDNVNPIAKRASVSHELTYGHTNFDEESHVSDGIEVSKAFYQAGFTGEQATKTNPCKEKLGEGWRLPNQLELTVLTSNRVSGIGYGKALFSSTQAKYPNGNNRYFAYSANIAGDMEMWGVGRVVSYYRCVRDIKR